MQLITNHPLHETEIRTGPADKIALQHQERVFYNVHVPWHIHLEYELVFIRMDNGIKHVGSHFGGIGGMEILLLGPNLPHNWLVNKRSAPVGTDTDYQVVIHFPKSVFGAGFSNWRPSPRSTSC